MATLIGLVTGNKTIPRNVFFSLLDALAHRGTERFTLISSDFIIPNVKKDPSALSNLNVKAAAAVASSSFEEANQITVMHEANIGLGTDGHLSLDSSFLKGILKEASSNPEKASMKILSNADGSFVAALVMNDRCLLLRDAIGVRPLYYGENSSLIGFASEPKALRHIGINAPTLLKAGHIVVLTSRGIVDLQPKPMVLRMPNVNDMTLASRFLRSKLQRELENIATRFPRLGVFFSGGIDSSLIAWMMHQQGANPKLIVSGVEDSNDVTMTINYAEQLGLALHVATLPKDDVEEYLSRIMWTIENSNPMDVVIAAPLYLAAEAASNQGFHICVTGQGCDELFGGYARYPKILAEGGYRGLHEALWRDAVNLSDKGLPRDNFATMAHRVEMLCPYLTSSVFTLAFDIAPELKIFSLQDSLRKRVVRAVAKAEGMPIEVVERPKKAAQFSSGFEKALNTLARKRGMKKLDYLIQLNARNWGIHSGRHGRGSR